MFSMPTSGPLSPIVSLERRKLENAGVQPGQEQQGAADIGSPISGDLAQLIQLNRMLQQQGGAQQQANAAPSTVAQDLMQLAVQQRAPQMQPQMQGQMPPQMNPQMSPRQQGIAQLPQEAVGTKAMASGGIVAFNGEWGSDVHSSNFNMMDDVEEQRRKQEQDARDRANAEMEAKRQAALAAIAARARAVNPIGQNKSLTEVIPTVTKKSPLDLALENAGFDIQKDYTKARKKLEEESGYSSVIKAQEDEQKRLAGELTPEEERKAMLRNFAANVASKIGQPRTVSRGSGIAQILGAYSTASAETKDDFKKRTADLNAAANALKERQAISRMTGAASDAAKMEQAQKDFEKAALDKENAERLAKQEAANERFKERQLQVQAAAGAREKTPWESFGQDIKHLQKLIQAKQASGASAQEIAPIQTQLDSLLKTYNMVNPGLYRADTSLQQTAATLEQKARQAAATSMEYKNAESKLRLIQSNPEVNPITGQKFKNPAERNAAIANLESQKDRVIAAHMVKLNREGTAQGDAGSGSDRVIDFNDWNSK